MARVTILQYSEFTDSKRGVKFLPTNVTRDGATVILGVAENVPDDVAREYLAQPAMYRVEGLPASEDGADGRGTTPPAELTAEAIEAMDYKALCALAKERLPEAGLGIGTPKAALIEALKASLAPAAPTPAPAAE